MRLRNSLSLIGQALGPDAYVVGGAVRDRLLGRETDDLDVVVTSNPDKAAAHVAAAVRGRAFPLHLELGIHRVVTDTGHVDIAQIQGRTLEEDIDRRDFSINALTVPFSAWRRARWQASIIDRHGGLADLRRRRIVPLSKNVFVDDPLRLLRAFRIAAELDFALPTETLTAIRRHRRLARKPAAERLREEMLRLFSTPRAYETLLAMDRAGLLDVIFPNAPALRRTAPRYYGKGGVLKHTLDSVKHFEKIAADLKSWFPGAHAKVRAYLSEAIAGYPRVAHCKWGLLLHDIGKPKTAKVIDGRLRFFQHEHVGADLVEKVAPIFRWSSDEQGHYARLVRNHMRPGNLAVHPEAGDKAFHRFFRDLEDDAVAMLLVSLADHLTYLTPAQLRKRSSAHERVTIKMMSRYYRHRRKVLPERLLTGFDIMKAFHLKPSPLIGKLLSEVTDAQVDGKVSNKDQAIAHLRTVLPTLEATDGRR